MTNNHGRLDRDSWVVLKNKKAMGDVLPAHRIQQRATAGIQVRFQKSLFKKTSFTLNWWIANGCVYVCIFDVAPALQAMDSGKTIEQKPSKSDQTQQMRPTTTTKSKNNAIKSAVTKEKVWWLFR